MSFLRRTGPDVWAVLLVAAMAAPGCGETGPTEGPTATLTSTANGVHGWQRLAGHVTQPMAKARLLGSVERSRRLRVGLSLSLRDRDGLERFVDDVSDPTSPRYRQYLTPEEIADRFGPSPAEYQQVLDWAAARGLDAEVDRHRLHTIVTAPVATLEGALHVHLNRALRDDGSEFFGPDQEPSLDLDLPVAHVAGLDDHIVPKSAGVGGSGNNQWIAGRDIRPAYLPSCNTMTGAGESVGILSLGGGLLESDIQTFVTRNGFQNVPPVLRIGNDQFISNRDEDVLDVEMAIAMAPAAQVVAFRELGNTDLAVMDAINHPEVRQVTSSYFVPIQDTSLILTMAAQGQSLFEASGDGGAYNVGSDSFTAGDLRVQPTITVVGGTVLTMNPPGSSYLSETTWSGSSGGVLEPGVGQNGISFPLPAYQVGLANANNHASTVYRNLPDVSAAAIAIEMIFNGVPLQAGGTSVAAPLWAGFTALLNQQASSHYMGPLGPLNPALYMVAKSPSGPNSFHDITSGTTVGTPITYTAVAGYDMATGLGTPSCGMFNALANARSSGFGPGSAVHDGVLHVGYVANSPSNTLLHIASTNGKNWGPESPLSGQSSKAAPTLISFNGKLRMFYIANDSSNTIYQTTSTDGLTWSSPVSVASHASKATVGAAVFGGVLHLVYIKNDSSNGLLHVSSSNGTSWGGETPISGESSQAAPAVASFNGKLRVYFLTNDSRNLVLQTATTNGTTWTRQSAMNRASGLPPAVAAIGSTLHMIFTSNDGANTLLHMSSGDGLFVGSSSNGVAGHSTKAAPTVAALPTAFLGQLRLSYLANDSGNLVLRISSADGITWGAETAW